MTNLSNIVDAIDRAETRAQFSYFDQLIVARGNEIFVMEDHEFDLVTMARFDILLRIEAGLSDEDQGCLDFDMAADAESYFNGDSQGLWEAHYDALVSY